MRPRSSPVTARPDGAALAVRVIPRAGRNQLGGVREGALVVRLTAPPLDNAANDDLITWLARWLDLPRRAFSIERGQRGRSKIVHVAGTSAAELSRRLPHEGLLPAHPGPESR